MSSNHAIRRLLSDVEYLRKRGEALRAKGEVEAATKLLQASLRKLKEANRLAGKDPRAAKLSAD